MAAFDAIEAQFKEALASGLGWDLTPSWVIGGTASGVHKVELPAPSTDIRANATRRCG